MSRRPIVAVLDACVLYPNYPRDFLLSTAFYGRLYAPHWSEEILDELRRNLVADGRMTTEKAARLLATMQAAFPYSEVARDGRLVPCLTNHQKDRHVVETALV